MGPSPPPLVSVVLPVRNGASTIEAQLEALEAQRTHRDFEVIIVDNGSTDATRAIVSTFAETHPRFRLVTADKGTGVSHARNVGATHANGSRILFCDSDDEVDPAWLGAMADGLETRALVGGSLDFYRLNARESIRPSLRRTVELRPWPGHHPFVSGANLGVRRELFDRLDGFDEGLVGGDDDTDFTWRAIAAGSPPMFCPDAVVHYRERTRLVEVFRQFRGYGRMDPPLYRRHRARGMPRPPLHAALRSWGHLVVFAPRYLRTHPGRGQWVRSVGRRLGRIEGSIRSRTIYL